MLKKKKKKTPNGVNNNEFQKGDQFKHDSPFYYKPSHKPKTKRNYEKLYQKNPLSWKIIIDRFKKAGIEFNLDGLNQALISDVPVKKCLGLLRDESTNKQMTVLKALTDNALYASDDEAEKADKWLTVYEIHLITGIKQSTIGANLRDFRKPPMGGFSVLRRSRGKRGSKVYEYCIIPDTKCRRKIGDEPEDLMYF